MANDRNAAADTAKGIAILMVIVGHFQVATPMHLQRLAASFHMPLFFFLAGAFFRPKPVVKALKSDATRLLLPLLVSFAVYKVFCWGLEKRPRCAVLSWVCFTTPPLPDGSRHGPAT